MNIEQENFAIQLTDNTKTHDEWLAVVQFGLNTLLQSQPLLMEVIVREAERMASQSKVGSYRTSDHAMTILKELKLRLTAASPTVGYQFDSLVKALESIRDCGLASCSYCRNAARDALAKTQQDSAVKAGATAVG